MPHPAFSPPPVLRAGFHGLFSLFVLLVSFALSTLALSACAAGPASPHSGARGKANTEAEDAEMLRLAREGRLELQTQAVRLGELEGQVRDLSEMIAWNAAQTAAHARALDSLRHPGGVHHPGAGLAPRASSSPPALAALSGPGRISPDEATAYRMALDLHFARQYPAAVTAFRDLLARHPAGAYAANAEYWIGEGLYAQGDYTGALTAFQRVFAHPGSAKTDDARLKVGYCYLRLGDRARAASEFRNLVSSHPGSEYVERARGELHKLGQE